MLKYGEIGVSYFVKLLCESSDLLLMSFRVWLQVKTKKVHKSFKALPCLCYTKIKYSAAHLTLYFTYSTRGNALTYILKTQ